MRVKVYKNDVEVGWYKDLIVGANAVIATCKNHGFDILQYEFRDFDDPTKIVWKGEKSFLDDQKVV